MPETIKGKCDGISLKHHSYYLDKLTYASNEHIMEFTALPCDPAKFVKHYFLFWMRMVLPEDSTATVNWEVKNITKSQVIDSGTDKFTMKVVNYTTYSGEDTIRFRTWLSTGNFLACGIQVWNHTHYNP